MMELKWIPNESLGVFKLGDKISNYLKKYNLNFEKYFGELVVSYELSSPYICSFVKNNIIESISAYEEFIYRNVNFIGKHIDSLIPLLPTDYEYDTSIEYDDGSVQTPVEFTDFGLTLWLDEEDKVLYASIYDVTD